MTFKLESPCSSRKGFSLFKQNPHTLSLVVIFSYGDIRFEKKFEFRHAKYH